jgi:hypothetical protein
MKDGEQKGRGTVMALLVSSVLALILGPVVILMGAFSMNSAFIGGVLIIMGALGLYAGMKSLDSGA